MNTRLITIIAGLAATSIAPAQSQFSLVSWFASLDNGQTWQGGSVEVADPFARVRIRAEVDWEYPGSYAFSAATMDVTISNAGAADEPLGYGQIAPFNSGARPLAVMRFGNIIKIDDARDTLFPGSGQYSIQCYQPAQVFGFPFSTDRPAHIFQFVLDLDGTAGTRTIDHVYQRSTGSGDELPPLVYLSPEGGVVMPRPGLRGPLNLVVIPAPGSLGLLLPLLALHRRRRE